MLHAKHGFAQSTECAVQSVVLCSAQAMLGLPSACVIWRSNVVATPVLLLNIVHCYTGVLAIYECGKLHLGPK